MPPEANVFARRVPIPLFGAGLVEAIPDDAIVALEDPFDRDRDGVSGRAARIEDAATGERRIGRFGWKAQHATLLTFGADAYRNEMGITNDVFSAEVAFGVTAERMRACDPIADPEDIARSADAAARHRQLRQLHALPRAGRARRLERADAAPASRCSRRSAARPAIVPC